MDGDAPQDPGRDRLDDFTGDVLDMVDAIPPGHVMSYGDVAACLGRGGPRQVGRVMAVWGGAVPWWRVVHADGSPAPHHEHAALTRYKAEGTPLRPGGETVRVDMRRARWRPLRHRMGMSVASAGIRS